MSASKKQKTFEVSMDVRHENRTSPTFITMGEAMIRFLPVDKGPVTAVSRHMPQQFLRSIGGDELNVAVALAFLGVKSRWVSVLPEGPMGDVVTDSCTHHGVEFAGTRVDGDIGTFTVLPEAKTVHYQRRQSVFALHDPDKLNWSAYLHDGGKPWLHITGITPLISASSRQSWDAAQAAAAKANIPVSLDLNHRKQARVVASCAWAGWMRWTRVSEVQVGSGRDTLLPVLLPVLSV